jgi:hypothetical protein
MGYLGTKPANSPLTSELIPDGLINTSDIADGAITTAKIGNGAVVPADLSSDVYVARAWVNFNGQGTVAIRASGNVSSITDNGTGEYTINFTVAISDANYASSAMPLSANAGATVITTSKTTSTFRVIASLSSTGVTDFSEISVTVFR